MVVDERLSLLESCDVGKLEECLDKAFDRKHSLDFRAGK